MERRRPVRFIKKDIQCWLIGIMVSFFTISLSAGFFIFYLWSHRKIGETFYKAHYTINYVSDLLLPVIIICGLICFVFCIIFTLLFQQKVVGPLYRIEQDLRKVAEGDFNVRVKIRATDRFHSLEDAVNSAIDTMRRELVNIYFSLSDIQELLETERYEEAKKEVARLKERLERLKLS